MKAGIVQMNRQPVLSGSNLNKTYHSGGRTVHPLQYVSFELWPGEILGIVGESGSGKSTLLRVISGLEFPDSGALTYNGIRYHGDGPEKTGKFLQMIFQNAYGSFDPRMTMERSLREGSGADRQDIVRMICEVGLTEDLLERKPRHLSGGQCQRMSIARALLTKAKILLCDEITSALDVTTQAQVINLLTEIRDAEGVSIILVSHDLALVSMICDRIMVMQDGYIVDQGRTEDVINAPSDYYTRKLLSSIISV